MAGLKWSDIDFDKGILNVAGTIDDRPDYVGWEIRSLKSKAGAREIPLTREAVKIPCGQKAQEIRNIEASLRVV